MSGLAPPRLIALIAFCLSPLAGCGGEAEQRSTLPSSDQRANPPTAIELAIEPASPANLADYVEAKARALARQRYAPPEAALPARLAGIDYEQYRSIRFRPEAALWRGQSRFEVQLFHPGYLFTKPVKLHLVDDDEVAPVPFDESLFQYDGTAAVLAGETSPDLGYAGFRIHYPINDSSRMDEVAVFQGASYFRLVGPNQVYGLSARGLAVDIARDSGEEFPDFTEFWLRQPAPEETTLVFYALLDAPSVTGSYRFELKVVGPSTTLAVDAHLFARQDVAKLGIAPFSSMFLYDANLSDAFDDFRPEVHDSDGLMMLTRKGEWIWRPLGNRRGLRVTSLRDRDPQGFGMVQRERDFDHYLDLEARYERRPSAWVQVEGGDWGEGGVELLEIPTESEFNDNIATYWVPSGPFLAGEERRFLYRLVTFGDRLESETLAHVERTRIGWDALPGQVDPPARSRRRFIVDFSGGAFETPDSTQPVEAILEASSGKISDLQTHRLPANLGLRVSFRLDPEGNRPADMRLYLERDGDRMSETWSYVWYPEQVR